MQKELCAGLLCALSPEKKACESPQNTESKPSGKQAMQEEMNEFVNLLGESLGSGQACFQNLSSQSLDPKRGRFLKCPRRGVPKGEGYTERLRYSKVAIRRIATITLQMPFARGPGDFGYRAP